MHKRSIFSKTVSHLYALTAALSGCLAGLPVAAVAQDTEDRVQWNYNPDKGLQVRAGDNALDAWVGIRLQSRYSTADGALTTPDKLRNADENFSLNRGRIKGGGKVYDKATVYSEYDFTTHYLLDLRATALIRDWLNVRAGQWKMEYNRERFDSSGKQTFVERSIATYWFTLDRQKGVSASGRLGAGSRADSTYWLSVFSGAGRGGSWKGSSMLMARYQWNIFGKVLPFSQSDIKRRDTPHASLAFAAAGGKSRFTRFSGAGGGQLEGYANSDNERYRLRQALQEFALHYRGLSVQQELHVKRITDRDTGNRRSLAGGYIQSGYFFGERWEWFPDPLEVAVRYAQVDPDRDRANDTQREATLGLNWFFNGHRNKLTTDISRLAFEDGDTTARKWRWRLQWDVSF